MLCGGHFIAPGLHAPGGYDNLPPTHVNSIHPSSACTSRLSEQQWAPRNSSEFGDGGQRREPYDHLPLLSGSRNDMCTMHTRCCRLQDCLDHVNEVEASIKFTVKVESESRLPYNYYVKEEKECH